MGAHYREATTMTEQHFSDADLKPTFMLELRQEDLALMKKALAWYATDLQRCAETLDPFRELPDALEKQAQNIRHQLKIFEGEEDGIGAKTGYVNAKGDTIISMGKYKYCFTDTLKTIAIVMDHDNLFKAIDVNDKILYQVKTYDNGPDYISEGLFRIIIEGKTGYANEAGEIIIQPQYACTAPFEEGKARVALKCELIKEGEHTRMESEEWFFIDTLGNRIAE